MPSRSLTPEAECIRAFLAELLGRYSHLRAFVDRCSKDARGRSPNLFAAYLSEIGEAEEELVSFAPSLFAASETVSTKNDLFGSFDFLVESSIRFQKNHEALRSFATPWPDSEVFQFLNLLFAENGLASDFQSLHPTIVNSDEFNFLKYDLRRDLLMPTASSAFAVWALPKSESTNPLLWPVLAHEVAHSFLPPPDPVLKELELKWASQQSPQEYAALRQWAMEFNADYFAYRLLGPAYIMCLMYFSMFFVDLRLRDPLSSNGFVADSHPPPNCRITFLRSEFEGFCAQNHVGANSKLKHTYDKFLDIYDARLRLDTKRLDWDPVYKQPDDSTLKTVWNVVTTAQRRATPHMRQLCFCVKELETAHRLGTSLNAGFVAGSVRADQSIDQVRAWLKGGGLSPSKKDMLRHLNERPARMFEIVNAGWVANVRSILGVRRVPEPASDVTDASGEVADGDYGSAVRTGVSQIVKDSRYLSLLLQKSIQISIVLSSLSPNADRHRCD